MSDGDFDGGFFVDGFPFDGGGERNGKVYQFRPPLGAVLWAIVVGEGAGEGNVRPGVGVD